MSYARILVVADPEIAEPKEGKFISIVRDEKSAASGPGDWLTPVLWKYQERDKFGGVIMPCTDTDDDTGLRTEELVAKLSRLTSMSLPGRLSIFMTEADAMLLVPTMVVPRVPVSLEDESVSDVLLDLVIGRLSSCLLFPPTERNKDNSRSRKKS